MTRRNSLDEASSELLDAWLDGELEDAAQAEAARRLAAEPELRRHLAELQALRRQVAHLPREIAPAIDLWPGIESRLHAGATPPGHRRLGRAIPWPGRLRIRGRLSQALAAVLGAALGGLLTFVAMTGGAGAPTSRPAGEETPADSRRVAEMMPAGMVEDEVSLRLEADFLRARETLWVQLLARRDQLPPETWHAVVENVGILDRAIRDLRHALGEDPGNRRLEKKLLASHQRQLSLLHRLSRQV